jgi:hypothetical protein
MAKITLDVPEDVAEMFKALEARLKALEADKTGASPAIPQPEFDKVTAGIALELKRRGLQALDIDAPVVTVDGKRHKRVLRSEATFYAKEGPVQVTRALFRECAVRNGPTVDPIAARVGSVGTWLPDVAKAAAFLVQQGTSREAEATTRATAALPYSRSSFERVAHAVGALHDVVRDEVEDALAKSCAIPSKTASLSVALDRVAVPMEEPRARPPGRPRKGAAKRPIDRVWHMAYVGTVTMHDAEGEALHTIRYGRMPALGCGDLLGRLFSDVQSFLRRTPRGLKVALLSDGAKEMVDALDSAFNRASLGLDVHRLVDFWHVIEKLGGAARAIHGSDAPAVVARWKLLLLNSTNAVSRILNELYASNLNDLVVGDERPVHDAITYLRNQGDRMGYVAARAAGIPIGSGNVEATCKSLIGQRLVRTGSRWLQDTGQHVIDLRALALSNRFDEAIELTLAPLVRHVRRAA